MKTNRKLIAAIALGTLMALSPASPAQEKQDAPKPAAPAAPAIPATPAPAPAARPRPDRTKQLAAMLNLTEEQQTKVKPVMEEEAKKTQELRDQKDLSPEDRRAKYTEIRNGTTAKLKPILTTEQWDKWEKLRTGGRPAQPGAPAIPAPAPTPPPAPAK